MAAQPSPLGIGVAADQKRPRLIRLDCPVTALADAYACSTTRIFYSIYMQIVYDMHSFNKLNVTQDLNTCTSYENHVKHVTGVKEDQIEKKQQQKVKEQGETFYGFCSTS